MKWGTPKEGVKAIGFFLLMDALFSIFCAILGGGSGIGSFESRWLTSFVGVIVGFIVIFAPWGVWCLLGAIILRNNSDLFGKWVAVGAGLTLFGWYLYFTTH